MNDRLTNRTGISRDRMARRPRSSPPAPAPPQRLQLPPLTLAVKFAIFSGSVAPKPPPAAQEPPAPPAQMYCQRRSLSCSTSFCESEHKRSQTPKPDPWLGRWHRATVATLVS